MRKYLYIIFILLSSCENFLDTQSYTRKDSGNFPQSREDMEALLVGAYNKLKMSERDNPLLWGSIIGDECFGNGGAGDHNWQGHNRGLRSTDLNEHSNMWSNGYQGVFRCNMILHEFEKYESFFTSESDKQEYLGQVHFLRAYYYFALAKFFGHYIPLRLQPTSENLPAATAEELYTQIGDDINKAINYLPSISIQMADVNNYGRITRWAAEALGAKIFLFYTGYYQKKELPTLSENISKQDAIKWLRDCVENSGHDLIKKYGDLYHYSNEYTNKDYPYAKINDLHWIGDEGKNIEAVFILKATTLQRSERGMIYGIRTQPKTKIYPFRDGWGCTTVNPKFFEQWKQDEPNDIRRNASILDITDPNEGLIGNYEWGVDQGEETGYFSKKFMDYNGRDAEGNISNFSNLAYGWNEGQGSCAVDWLEIRFSDVLLMLSELTEDATYLNRVRARVDLPAIPYSLENLQKERKHELAFEGCRYFDLLRWYGDRLSELGQLLDDTQEGAIFYRNGTKYSMTSNLSTRIPATGGFMEIPENEIKLSEGILLQNPGWSDSESIVYQPPT